jgi:hypothetical protein
MQQNELIKIHQDFLEDFGFTLDPSSHHYTKEYAHGRQIVFSHISEVQDVIYLEYHLGIRFAKVEYIVHEFIPSLGDYKDRSITLVENLDSFGKDLPRRFVLTNDQEVERCTKLMESFLIKEGFTWLDSHSQGLQLERYFNEYIDKPIISQNFTYRSARGVTLAKLFNPTAYLSIRKAYLQSLKDMQVTPFALACFLNLLSYLDSME